MGRALDQASETLVTIGDVTVSGGQTRREGARERGEECGPDD
jgi:hypothetical protein